MAQILKGAPVAAALSEALIPRAEKLREAGVVPTLAILRVGERPDDISYETGAVKRCEKLGIQVRRIGLPANCTGEEILEEIRQIRANIPQDMEIESFIHGAMCISYSGRCLLSNFLTGRDANQGACTHPCRWKYSLVEETRPGEYMPVYEGERCTYIFNCMDLCMI